MVLIGILVTGWRAFSVFASPPTASTSASWAQDGAWFQRLIGLYASGNTPIQQEALATGTRSGLTAGQVVDVEQAVRQAWVRLTPASDATLAVLTQATTGAQVQVRYVSETGQVKQQTINMPANAIQTVDAGQEAGASFAGTIYVNASAPVLAVLAGQSHHWSYRLQSTSLPQAVAAIPATRVRTHRSRYRQLRQHPHHRRPNRIANIRRATSPEENP